MQHAQAARPRPRSVRKPFAPTPLALAAGRARHGISLTRESPSPAVSLSLAVGIVGTNIYKAARDRLDGHTRRTWSLELVEVVPAAQRLREGGCVHHLVHAAGAVAPARCASTERSVDVARRVGGSPLRARPTSRRRGSASRPVVSSTGPSRRRARAWPAAARRRRRLRGGCW